MDSFHKPDTTQIVLDKLRFAAQTRISRQIMATAKIHAWEDIATNQLVAALEGEILAEKLVSETCTAVTKVPATWWQHFKLTNCYIGLERNRIMRWASKRWPVKYVNRVVEVRFERYAKFPNATIQVPELGAPVVFERWGEVGGPSYSDCLT